jgi:hypothetical protein
VRDLTDYDRAFGLIDRGLIDSDRTDGPADGPADGEEVA